MGSMMEARRRILLSSPHLETIQNADIASFSTDMHSPLRSLLVNIDPVQDLHGYDSPWPAGGGKNKFDKDHTINSTHTSSIATALSTYKSTGEYATGYTTNATSITANEQYCTTFTPCTSGTTYTIKNLTSGSNLALIGFVDDSGTVVSHNIAWSNQAWTHTADFTEKYIMVCANVAELQNVMIVEGSTMPSTWSPYSNLCPISGWDEANVWVKPTYDPTANPTATIQLGQTVYGGTLGVTNGVLRVTGVLEVFDTENPEGGISSNLGLTYINPTTTFADLGDVVRVSCGINTDISPNYLRVSSSYDYKMSNMLKHYFAYNDNSTHWYRNTVLYLFFPKSLVGSTISGVITYLKSIKDTTPLSLWIPLATPIEIPLTDITISTLRGANNLWADCGPVELLKYWTHK